MNANDILYAPLFSDVVGYTAHLDAPDAATFYCPYVPLMRKSAYVQTDRGWVLRSDLEKQIASDIQKNRAHGDGEVIRKWVADSLLQAAERQLNQYEQYIITSTLPDETRD